MDRIMKAPLFSLLVRLIIAVTFIAAAYPKILDPVEFTASVEAFQIVGYELSKWVALFLPWLEIMIGFGLLIPHIRRASGLLMSALLLLFVCLHASAWARGLDISCGCFGASEEESNYQWLLFRNTALLAGTVWLCLRDFKVAKS